MATVRKIIRLASQGVNAGPYYDLYTSLDCENYSLYQADIYLPNLGSEFTAVVDSQTACYKLVNKSDKCNQNELVKGEFPELLPSIQISDGYASSSISCYEDITQTKYYSSSLSYIRVGDKFYDDAYGVSLFAGSDLWYRSEFDTVYQIDNSGVVIDIFDNSIPTTDAVVYVHVDNTGSWDGISTRLVNLVPEYTPDFDLIVKGANIYTTGSFGNELVTGDTEVSGTTFDLYESSSNKSDIGHYSLDNGWHTFIYYMRGREKEFGNETGYDLYGPFTLMANYNDANSLEGIKVFRKNDVFDTTPGIPSDSKIIDTSVFGLEGGVGYDATGSLKLDNIAFDTFNSQYRMIVFSLNKTGADVTQGYYRTDYDNFGNKYDFVGTMAGINQYDHIFRNAGYLKSFLHYKREILAAELKFIKQKLQNAVGYNICVPPFTTTTTTTTSTSTTSTTTTSTTSGTGCYEYTVDCPSGASGGGCTINYNDCYGNPQTLVLPADSNQIICAEPTPSSTNAVITFEGPCSTTTTTSTTTSTTTAPTTTTTTTTTASPSTLFYLHTTEGNGDGSEITACSRTTISTPTYFTSSVGTFNDYVTNFNSLTTLEKRVYTDSQLTNPFDGATLFYGADSDGIGGASYSFLIQNGGDVGAIFNCTTTTTTTTTQAYQNVLLYEQSGGGGWNNSSDACDGVGGTSIIVVYASSTATIEPFTDLYTDTSLTNPFPGGNTWYQKQGTTEVIRVDNLGTIAELVDCSTTTTTTSTTSTTTTTTAAPCSEWDLFCPSTAVGGTCTFDVDCCDGSTTQYTLSADQNAIACVITGGSVTVTSTSGTATQSSPYTPCSTSCGDVPTTTTTTSTSTTSTTTTQAPNFVATGNYGVAGYTNVQYDVSLNLTGMTKTRTLNVGPSATCLTGCTYSSTESWNSGASGTITVARVAPDTTCDDLTDISINVTQGSATISNQLNPLTVPSGTVINYTWVITNASTDAIFEVVIVEG